VPVTGQDKSSSVTDLPFVDLIITHSAMMLPVMSSTPPCLITVIKDNGPEQIQQEGETKINHVSAIIALRDVMSHFTCLQMQISVPVQTCRFVSP
jgi:hypothetical protein